MKAFPRVRSGLMKHKLDDQILVYDPKQDRVHLLDSTTAAVLELLEEGGWTPEGIRIELVERYNLIAAQQMVELALDQLVTADLLEKASEESSPVPGISRRDVIRELTVAGVAAVLIPTIATLTATRAYAGTAGGVGTPCTSAGGCISNRCCGPAGNRFCRPAGCQDNANSNCSNPTPQICCFNGLTCPSPADKCGTAGGCL